MNSPEGTAGMKEVARAEVAALRQTMKKLGVVVAEVDRNLRYVWVDNPHPDFSPELLVGKRDDEIMSREEASEIMGMKRKVLEKGEPVSQILRFKRSDGWRYYRINAIPVKSRDGTVEGMLTFGFDTPKAGGEIKGGVTK